MNEERNRDIMSGQLSTSCDKMEKNYGGNNHQSPGNINHHPSHGNCQKKIK